MKTEEGKSMEKAALAGNGWINVKSKPKKNVTVLVLDDFLSEFFKGVQVSTAHWDGKHWYDYLGDKHVHANNITHWRGLPATH